MKVVFDAGNGVGGPPMHRLLENLNVDATEIFFEMDGRFPNHHPDPTVEENLAPSSSSRRKPEPISASPSMAMPTASAPSTRTAPSSGAIMLMLIYGREILTRKPGATFIGEVKCSQTLYDELARRGGNPIMCKTGHSLIKAKMKEEHAELAGEMSGHIFFADRYYGFDDALYAACRLIEIVANSGKPLSAQIRRPAPHNHHAGTSSRLRRTTASSPSSTKSKLTSRRSAPATTSTASESNSITAGASFAPRTRNRFWYCASRPIPRKTSAPTGPKWKPP